MTDTLHEYKSRPGVGKDGAPVITFGHEKCTWHIEVRELSLTQAVSFASEHHLTGCRTETRRR